ncbi:MAG: FAD-dependent oxidoreductase [Pirellulales bacterium]
MGIEHGREIDEHAQLDCDVCIVGGGAAGIAVALELARDALSVILLESGDWKLDPQTQALYEGQVEQPALHDPPQLNRARRFGGSTTVWVGRCVPFDAIDFERRDYVPHSGWPFGIDELLPFYLRANSICEAGEYVYRAADALPSARRAMIEGFASSRVNTDGLERFSRPTDFGRRYRRVLEQARHLRVVLGANCLDLSACKDSSSISHAVVSTLGGRRFTIRARQFVLAAGALEVTRLLLASRSVYPNGIGNDRDQVGRFYMCHIAGRVGRLEFDAAPSRVFNGYERCPDGVYCRRRLQLAADVQRSLGIGNLVARVHHPAIPDPSHRTGPLSALYLARHIVPAQFRKRVTSDDRSLALWARHVRNVIADPLDTARFLSHWVARRTLASRKFPTVVVSPKSQRYTLDFHAEQVPQPNSRVSLTDECDCLGLPRLRIDWRYSAMDVRTVAESLRVLAEEFERTNVGRLTFDDAEVEQAIRSEGAYAGHHIGTTRMSDSPADGVVDRNCRVHGLRNLFIASSSVFPTSSQANPTLTIVALALRLAEHLKSTSTRHV